MRVHAVVVVRDSSDALAPLGGVPLVVRSVRAMLGVPGISRVDVLVTPDRVSGVTDVCAALPVAVHGSIAALWAHAGQRSGGTDGDGSMTDGSCVLVHDAARPLVPQALIASVVAALDEHAAVVPVLDVTDTTARVEGDRVVEVPPRASLRRVQTPQGFDAATLWRAHARGRASAGFAPTDDASVVLHHGGAVGGGVPVHVVPGDERAFKVTVPADLDRLRRLLQDGRP